VSFAQSLIWCIATVGGIGHAPWASGTVASVAAVGVWYCWHPSAWTQVVVIGIVAATGVWAADRWAKRFGNDDPSQVVVDEVAGMWIALVGLPRSVIVAATALLLFRLLDIVKCPPMRQLERLPGGWGIMADDLAAGVIARIALGVGLWLTPWAVR